MVKNYTCYIIIDDTHCQIQIMTCLDQLGQRRVSEQAVLGRNHDKGTFYYRHLIYTNLHFNVKFIQFQSFYLSSSVLINFKIKFHCYHCLLLLINPTLRQSFLSHTVALMQYHQTG